MNTTELRTLITGRPGFTGMPPEALQAAVITCQYVPLRAAEPAATRLYWYESDPAWLAKIPASHPIHALIQGSATACPPVLSTPAAAVSEPPANLRAKGLQNELSIQRLYRGDFAKVELTRESTLFGALFSAYLNAYGRQCDSSLPANKVEMTKSVCAREQYTVNGYGVRVGGSTCVEYKDVGTGIFADPALYRARRELERHSAPDSIRDALNMVTRPDAIGHTLNLASDVKLLQQDMGSLVESNGCASPALKRFETNLVAYSRGQQGLRAPASSLTETEAPRVPAGPFRDSNYTKLLEDLIGEQSKTWAMNRFEPGSVAAVSVLSRDASGRPSKISGRYLFRGFNGRAQGGVTVDFLEGEPSCLYFADFPTTCRKASRRVAVAYMEGAYR